MSAREDVCQPVLLSRRLLCCFMERRDAAFSNEALEEVTAPGREDAESCEATSNLLPKREVSCMAAARRAAQKLNSFRSW